MRKEIKRIVIVAAILFGFATKLSAQGFNYQAVIRGADGQPLASQQVKVRITLQDSEGTTAYYSENHSATSSPQGVVSFIVGEGTTVDGVFADIPWNAGEIFMKVDVDITGESQYAELGINRLLAVPVALFAKDGNQGPQGDAGPQGEPGEEGLSAYEVWLSEGNVGTEEDFLLAIKGDQGVPGLQGETGDQGLQGNPGDNGKTILNGSVNPTSEVGNDGDFYLNTTTSEFFGPKDSGSWPVAGVSLVGPEGPEGTIAAGSAGQMLLHNGVEWAATNNIFVSSGNAGIGTTSPEVKLDVIGDIRSSGKITGTNVQVGESIADPDEPLFVVRNANNEIVFAIYQEGVRMYVASDTGKSGSKGGFAVGGLTQSKAGEEYFRVTPDSVRIYIDTVTVKGKAGSKGGFAVGGLTQSKEAGEEFFRITRDSSRIYVNTENNTKSGSKGGFAVGGLTQSKGESNSFMFLTPENYFIGHQSGIHATDSALYNSTMGYRAGNSITEGKSNIFVGYKSGLLNSTGCFNTFVGYATGYNNNSGYNSFLGFQSGYFNTSGGYNSFFGYQAGKGNETGKLTGSNNVFIGYKTGFDNSSGASNVFIGNQSGLSNTSGGMNVFIGNQAGQNFTTGSYNTFLGYQAGLASGTLKGTGKNNVAIGYKAGIGLTYGENNIFIGTEAGAATTGVSIDTIRGENTFIGMWAGRKNITGYQNIAIGYYAGKGMTTNNRNTIIGNNAGQELSTGNANVLLGTYAGRLSTSGESNTFVGYDCGYQCYTGSHNTFIGFQAGRGWGANEIGSYSVFIGNEAGVNETGSHKLYIENSSANKNGALIYGEFDNNILTFNADVGIGTTSPTSSLDIYEEFPVLNIRTSATSSTDAVLRIGGARTTSITDDFSRIEFYNYESGGPFELGRITIRNGDGTIGTSKANMVFTVNNGYGLVQGLIIDCDGYVGVKTSDPSWRFQVGETSNYGWVASNGAWQSSSDVRFKENIRNLDSALKKVVSIKGVYFNVKGDDPQKDVQVGFIAQDLEKILPEVVSSDAQGYKGISYSLLTPVLVEAIKEQQKIIEGQNDEIMRLNQRVTELESLKSELEAIKELLQK